MDKGKNKLAYIGLTTILLLLLIIIGASVYNKSPENGKNKNQDTANPAPSSLTNEDEGKSTASLDTQMQLPSLGATNLNVINIGNAGLLGVFWWLSSDYKKQLARHQVTNNEHRFTFTLSSLHYIVAGVVLVAMVGYIGYFFYQKYLVHKTPPSYSLTKDGGIFALTSFLTIILTNLAFYFSILNTNKTENNYSFKNNYSFEMRLLGDILMRFILIGVVYYLAIRVGIESLKSNRKIKRFDPEGKIMWVFSILVLTSIHNIMHLSKACTIPAQLLWAIPACFLYVQAYWYQQLPSSSNKKINDMIAYLFHTSHLWEGLGCVFMVYYLDFSFYRIIGAWIAWECFKYALYHLDIKKISDTAGYTASFPLGFTALLEGSFMILFVAFGLCNQFFPDILVTRWTQILYGASVLGVGLLIRLYCTAYKGSITQWGMRLSYGLLSISGGVVAFYYAWNGDNEKIQAIAGGGLLMFGLYLVPKFLNALAMASLTLAAMPLFLRKIARITQDFTAFWLQPNLDVMCTMIVTCMFECYRYDWRNEQQSQDSTVKKLIIDTLIIAFAIYFTIQVVLHNFPRYKSRSGLLEHSVFMCAYMRIFFSFKNEQEAGNNALVSLIDVCIYYMAVILWIHSLLNIQEHKGYRKTSLPSSCSVTKEDMYAIASTWDFLFVFVYGVRIARGYTEKLESLLIAFGYFTLRQMLSKQANNNNGIIISWGLTIIKVIINALWHVGVLGFMGEESKHSSVPNFGSAENFSEKRDVCMDLAETLLNTYLSLEYIKFFSILILFFVKYIISFILKENTFTLAKLQNMLHTGYIYVSQRFLRILVSLKASMHKSNA